MESSITSKLDKIRKPRVHITYEVETDGTLEEKELPFVVGVMGDYSGNHPGTPKESLKEREFIQIDPENFDSVMRQIKPGLNMKVENKIDSDGSDMTVNLNFDGIDDFGPDQIVQKIPELKALLDTRNKLKDLANKSDVSDELESILEDVLTNTDISLENVAEEDEKIISKDEDQ